jgi:hypothetical protein
MERAVACALDGPFGGAHWTRNGSRPERTEVDNFYCGAFRPLAFERAGLFDETLVRNQDDELNFRIRQSGGRLVLDPAISSEYFPRGDFRGLARQYYQYGVWKIPVMLKHQRVLSGRSRPLPASSVVLLLLGLAATRSGRAGACSPRRPACTQVPRPSSRRRASRAGVSQPDSCPASSRPFPPCTSVTGSG